MPIKKKQSARLCLWLDGWSLYLHSFPSTCKARLAAIFCCWLPNHRPLCGPKFWGWWRASPTCKYVFKMTFSYNRHISDWQIYKNTHTWTNTASDPVSGLIYIVYIHMYLYIWHCTAGVFQGCSPVPATFVVLREALDFKASFWWREAALCDGMMSRMTRNYTCLQIHNIIYIYMCKNRTHLKCFFGVDLPFNWSNLAKFGPIWVL